MARLSLETKDFTSEPLDRLKFNIVDKQGVPKTVPAVSAGFVKPRTFVVYKQPLSVFNFLSGSKEDKPVIGTAASKEEWLQRMEFMKEDLHWLLKLPYHRFWSQVVYYEGVHKCLESFLSNSPRYYDLHYLMFTEEMKQAHQIVHKLIFMVYLRMSTYKESKCNHLTPEYFGKVIYDNFLFDIPKIMDLCILYGNGNHALLNKMINNIFSVQPKYLEDLEKIVSTILHIFDSIQEKLGLVAINAAEGKKLSDYNPCILSSMPWLELQDVVLYLVDISATLSAFLDIFPLACNAFHHEELARRLPAFYEAVFPQLQSELKNRSSNIELKVITLELKKRLSLAKSCLVKSFRSIIATCCIQPLIESSTLSKGSSKDSKDVPYLEDFLETIAIAVTEKSFITAYQQLYPFEEDMDIISQTSLCIDQTRVEYILSGIYSSYEKLDSTTNSHQPGVPYSDDSTLSEKFSKANLGSSSSSFLTGSETRLVNGSLPVESGSSETFTEGASAGPKLEGSELKLLVHKVLDVLPDLQSNFVEACLDYYNYDFEKVINAVLEQSLPSSLSSLQQDSSWEQESSVKGAAVDEFDSVLSGRRNVYDNDEFDIFSQETVDVSRIHKGKRDSIPENFGDLPNDVEHKKILKDVCQRYGLTEVYVEENSSLYEDEYDDTYDSTVVGLEEPPEEDETNIRPFVTPRVLEGKKTENGSDSNDSDEEESQAAAPEVRRDQFVANPAELREKAEQRRQAQAATRRNTPHNVRGNNPGQGQNDDTLRNRRFKERHKDFHANHNRRNQADRKRQKGMFPT